MPKITTKAAATSIKGRGKRSVVVYSAAEKADLRKLGRGISLLIGQSGKSPERFAFEAGISKAQIYKILSGHSDVKFCTLRTIALNLGYKNVAALLHRVYS